VSGSSVRIGLLSELCHVHVRWNEFFERWKEYETVRKRVLSRVSESFSLHLCSLYSPVDLLELSNH
jgi:hypothetical protein